MIVYLKQDDMLRLRRSAGATVDVLEGRVWISEEGRAEDVFVEAGGRHPVAGDGLVLVGAERDGAGNCAARVIVQALAQPLRVGSRGARPAVGAGGVRYGLGEIVSRNACQVLWPISGSTSASST